jgi:hypothetical protein
MKLHEMWNITGAGAKRARVWIQRFHFEVLLNALHDERERKHFSGFQISVETAVLQVMN